ncbi:hypothetical protein FT663_01348 [Candidozyma haemuli var. vulneris]|nr:hypothetical protein FT662_01713 [[Candida] haemuloni var. vulneris]KAF3994548.1 hypothetical protein FT663_01348 [[Candida] haemuloni var. vulneris]
MVDDPGSVHNSLPIPSSPERVNESNEYRLQTPPQRQRQDVLEQDITTPTDTLDHLDSKKKFESIVSHVNRTLQELSEVYSEIGYSSREINQRQADVFLTIDDTIKSISSSALREKNSVQNECEWLRQQIRFMLATLNDNHGEKTLKLSSRGIVFEDDVMYATGYREDIKEQVHSFHHFNQPSFEDSQFEDDDIANDGYSMQQQYDYMTRNVPQLTLLQTKSSLNNIFLDVLKAFVKVFRKFSDLSFRYWDNVEIIGVESAKSNSLISQLPSKSEAEEYLRLSEDFENTVKQLRLTDKMSKAPYTNPANANDDDNAFVISSPKKAKIRDLTKSREDVADLSTISQSSPDETMSHLRELNGKLITALRNLKIIKLNSQVIQDLSMEVEHTKADVASRAVEMKDFVNKCLDMIVILSLSDTDLIKIQQRAIQGKTQEYAKEGPFDSEALKLIEGDILAFGLETSKLLYLQKLTHTLVHLRDSKQKKWNYYMSACMRLWDKLCESPHFVSQFQEENATLSEKSLANLKMELNRLYMKRSEFIGSFIVDTQKEISEYQSLLLYSDSQRQSFDFFGYNADDDSDDKEHILNLHEAELNRLKEEYESKKPILELYKELNEYLEDQRFLEESSKDSSRLLQKDSCKILMKEERIRKTIHRNLPRVIKAIKEEVIHFNKEMISREKKPFAVAGQDLYEKILSIESQCSNQKRSRFTRGTSPRRPSVSPRKPEPSSSQNGSTKNPRLRSPIKVGKEVTQRRVSPALHSASLSRSPAVSERRSLTKSSSLNRSPEELRVENGGSMNGSTFESPPKASRISSTTNVSLRSQLPPLHSPLNPETSTLMNFSPSESTLYSMCSRVSPLRDKNTNVRADFTPIREIEANQEDKENAGSAPPKNLSPNGAENDKESTNHRLSTHSLANSTVISDVNEDWKEQRLRDIQSRNDRFYDNNRLS